MVNIRKSVRARLASILIGLSACSETKPTEAEIYFRDFPTTLDGAREVQKYEAPGAKHCLVHVRQIHYVGPKDSLKKSINLADRIRKDSSYSSSNELQELAISIDNQVRITKEAVKSEFKKVSGVQQDILYILGCLNRSNSLNYLRAEGLERALHPSESKEIYNLLNLQSVQTGFFNYDEIDSSDYFGLRGAHFIISRDKAIIIKPAEDKELNEQASRLADSLISQENLIKYDIIGKDREDFVLKIINLDNDPYSVTVYGGTHDFRDNVEAWNKKNPGDKFSLIVVTPTSYKK